MNKKIFLLSFLALPLAMWAEHLSPQQALQRAAGSMPSKVAGAHAQSPSLVYTISDTGTDAVYVFASAGRPGFMLLSADDNAAPVLGYSDSGTFDMANMPDNAKAWIQDYARQINFAAANNIRSAKRNPSRLADVSPMMVTKWNQGAPFNGQCPMIGANQCLTGCVATAMAQVMYYYQWPAQGVGSNSYNHSLIGNIALDFSTVTFDWGDMTPTYGSGSSQASKDAVAELMYACGVSVNMGYNTGTSGAYSTLMVPAFRNYFSYDPGACYMSRSWFSNQEWESLVYSELISGRPVLYDSQSSGSDIGHQFVCDGYSDGYFHINWGWGGLSDGYFLLSALDPDNQGLGGTGSAYDLYHNIVVGLQPITDNPVPYAMMYSDGWFMPSAMSYGRNDYVVVTFVDGQGAASGLYNRSDYTLNGYLGLRLVSEQGDETIVKSSGCSLAKGYGYKSYSIKLDGVANGTYAVFPGVYDSEYDRWVEAYTPAEGRTRAFVTVTDTRLEFEVVSETKSLQIDDFSIDSKVFDGRKFGASGRITSDADYTTMVCVALFPEGGDTPLAKGANIVLNMKANESREFKYMSGLAKLNGGPVVGETYEMQVVDENMNPLSDRVKVQYLQAPSGTTTIAISNLRLATGDSAPKNNIKVQGTITCYDGYFDSSIPLYLFPGSGGTSLDNYNTPILLLEAGESGDFEFVTQYMEGTVGEYYMIVPLIGSSWDNNRLYFMLTEAVETEGDTQVNVLTFEHAAYAPATPANVVRKDADGSWHADVVNLVDAVQFYNPCDLKANTINYTRTFVHDNWAALYLPYDLTAAEWSTYATRVIEYTGDTEIAGETVLVFETVAAGATLQANHPYIMLPAQTGEVTLTVNNKTLCATPLYDACVKPDGANYALYGQYEVKDDMFTSRAYALKDGNFHHASGDGVQLMPFRAYLMAEASVVMSAPQRIPILIDQETEGISSVLNDGSVNVIYDLNGRRVDNPAAGIYILNGRKVLIK